MGRINRRGNKLKKVLYVSNRTGYSGAEVVLLRLIQSNKDVTPIVLAPAGLLTERLKAIGVKVYFSSNILQLNRKQNRFWKLQIVKNLIFGFLELTWVMLWEKPDIVHANGLGASIYTSIPTWVFRKPSIWTDHDVFEVGQIEASWAKKLHRFSKKIITVSHYVGNSLLKLGIPAEKVITIYNGLDYSYFDPEKVKTGYLREKLNIDSDKKVIALFALITPWKGHHILIEAAKKLIDQGRKDFVVALIGETDDESYKKQLDDQVKKLNLGEIVKFTGFVESTSAAYKDVDILINASIKPEPLGTTIYEGMAMERLVIASNIGGNPEIVVDNKTGFLVTPSSPELLAEKINYVLDNPNLIEKMKTAAREEVIEKFELSLMVKNYNQVYTDVARHKLVQKT